MPAQTDYPDLPATAPDDTPPPDVLTLFRKLRERVAQKPAYNKAEWTTVESALSVALSLQVNVQPAAPGYLEENLLARALDSVQALPVDLQAGVYGNGAADFKRRALAAIKKLGNGKG